MNLTFKHILKGKLLYFKNRSKYLYYNGKIFEIDDSGKNLIFSLPMNSLIDKLSYFIPTIARLFRKGVHHLEINNQGLICVIFNNKIALVNIDQIISNIDLIGSRPLSLESMGKDFFYGEYRSNPERSPVGIYSLDSDGFMTRIHQFKGIRHVHGVYPDPYTDSVWISTGDENDEATVFQALDNFNIVQKVLAGTQQTRTIKILFSEQHIYFGSDAPDEINYLYRMERKSKKLEKLAQVGSSVFHGTKIKNWLFFSTAIEPSKVNTTDWAELWASPDGVNWKCILTLKKDFLSKHFQYGQILFPKGDVELDNLWICPLATEFDNRSICIDLKDVEKVWNEL